MTGVTQRTGRACCACNFFLSVLCKIDLLQKTGPACCSVLIPALPHWVMG